MESHLFCQPKAAAFLALVTLLPGCKQVDSFQLPIQLNSYPDAAGTPYEKLDQLRKRFPSLRWWDVEDSDELAKEFELIRSSEAWKAFVIALRVCDDCVNSLLEEDITDWSNPGPKINRINRARNAWRSAVTYGIRPPALSRGSTSFEEEGLHFRLHVVDGAKGVLVVRSQRDQVLGIFDLRLDDGGRQHIVAHMLERALRSPDSYLSYPWDIIMATDTIHVPDIDVYIDRVKREVTVRSAGTAGEEVRK